MKINLKIAGLLFLLSLSVFILYISIHVEDKQIVRIKTIEIYGGKYIASNDYASFAMLQDTSCYRYLDAAIIKDRIERHPYVEKADVKLEGLNRIIVQVREKKFTAALVDSTKQILLTENLQLIPYMNSSIGLNLPVISNVAGFETLKNFTYTKNNYEIITALKILDAFRFTNGELSDNLSQIDLRKGKDILVYFSNIKFPVIFGRKDEIKKAVYFNSLWKFMNGNEINNYLDYVDLRFDRHVFLGVAAENSGNEEKQI